MKNKLLVLSALLILCASILSGCGCEHQWQDATCTAPKTCALCQETEGEAAGHSWTEATCEVPKTCAVCGETEGEALGHSWTDATCEAPKTCAVCSKTEGETLEHTFGDWADVDSTTQERTCTACGYAEQQAIDHLAALAELLPTRWICSGIIADGQYIESPDDNYVCVFRVEDNGTLTGLARFVDAYTETKAIELHSYDSETGTYIFFIDGYPSYPLMLMEIEGTPTLLLTWDETLTLVYEKEY